MEKLTPPRKLRIRPEESLVPPVTTTVIIPIGKKEKPPGVLMKEAEWVCCFPECSWALPPNTPLYQAVAQFGKHLLSIHPFDQFDAKLGRKMEFRMDPKAIDTRKR